MCVIFCVALSEYDLKLLEDEETNRMRESLNLFKEVCSNPWLCETAVILFFNKRDLYEEKIKRVSLKVCFPEYEGPGDMKSTMDYIRLQFEAQNKDPKRHIYSHTLCATDTNEVRKAFMESLRDSVLRKALDNAGIV